MKYQKEKTKNISFPLGGIGTGCIGLSGNGELIDWEIFNRPDKCSRNGRSHFAIKATDGEHSTVKILHGDTNENLIGTPAATTDYRGYGFGPAGSTMAGFPHFSDVVFDGSFPIARLSFSDKDFPATVRLTAFNPFIPHEDFNSSLPSAFFQWEIENTTDRKISYALALTVQNPAKASVNKKVSDGGMQGIFLGCADKTADSPEYSDLCILTDAPDASAQEYWYRGRWMDGCTTYWKNISTLPRMPERSYEEYGSCDHGTLTAYVDIPAGERAKVRFVISWNVPTAYNHWEPRESDGKDISWKNYYATKLESSYATAKYSMDNFSSLYEKTQLFSDTLQSCTLPEAVIDAISSNLSVLKSPTALRLTDGSFWGWEGCIEKIGSCFGSCQHVWNYAYAMPYLFPRLERSMREITMKYALMDSGATGFRVNLPLKRSMDTVRSCLDGQMGEVIKCYREWKLSGDNEWLKEHSESIFRMLEFAWSSENPDRWDADCDGILEGRQHHTLDMELFGPSSWLQGMYLLALDCGARMADFLGETERALLYRRLYKNGRKFLNSELFNGSYFFQKVDLSDKATLDSFGAAADYWNDEAGEIKYQVAEGCIIDQMLADWHAMLIGMPPVFDNDKKATALQTLYKSNYKSSMRGVVNMWRNFALNDEGCTMICTYPEGARLPAIPIPYCEEAMTGFEYALAGLMIGEGKQGWGEEMVKAVRHRYDGEKRNPWNEIECGSNYARSMASYALMPIYSGFSFDMTKGHIGFAPKHSGRYLFSVKDSWGKVETDEGRFTLTVLGDTALELKSIKVSCPEKISSVTVDGETVSFRLADGTVMLGDVAVRRELIIC